MFSSVEFLLNLCSSTHSFFLKAVSQHCITSCGIFSDIIWLFTSVCEVKKSFQNFWNSKHLHKLNWNKSSDIMSDANCLLVQTNILIVVLFLPAVQDGGGGDGTPCWPGVFRPIRRCSSCFPFFAWAWPWYTARAINFVALWPASSSRSTTSPSLWLLRLARWVRVTVKNPNKWREEAAARPV